MITTFDLPDGTVVLDAHAVLYFEEVRSAQRSLAEYRVNGFDTVHVAGRIAGDDATGELDSLGRINVRLNIHHLVAVGQGAHAMHRAAEQEGSWDGESIPVSTVDDAYDEVMRLRGDRVAVLVTGSTEIEMSELVARLKGELP